MAKSYFEKLLSDSENRYGEGGTDFASPEDRTGNTYAALEGELQGMGKRVPYAPDPILDRDYNDYMENEEIQKMEEPEVEEQVNDIVEAQNAPAESSQEDIQQLRKAQDQYQALEQLRSYQGDFEDSQVEQKEDEPELTPQQKLLEEFRKYRTQQKEDLESARSTDDKIELLNQLNKSFVQANKALGSGFANVDPRALDIGSGDLEDKTRKDYQDRLQNMMKEYKILSAKDEDQLSARDKAYLDYYNRKLEMTKEREGRLVDQFGEKKIQKSQKDAEKALEMLRKKESWKSADKTLSEVPTLVTLLEDAYKKGGQSLAMLGPKVARSIAGEVGVLTEQDVTRYVKNPELVAGFMDTIKELSEGKITEASYNNLKRLLEISKMEAERKQKESIEREAILFSRREKIPFEDALSLLDANYNREDSNVDSKKEMSEQDKSALKWANENKDDPRSEQIIEKLKLKGLI